jgi:hypothetical protein
MMDKIYTVITIVVGFVMVIYGFFKDDMHTVEHGVILVGIGNLLADNIK